MSPNCRPRCFSPSSKPKSLRQSLSRSARHVVAASMAVLATTAPPAGAAPLFSSVHDAPLSVSGHVIGIEQISSLIHVFTTDTFYTAIPFDGTSLTFNQTINVPFLEIGMILVPDSLVSFNPASPGWAHITGWQGFHSLVQYYYRFAPEAFSSVPLQGSQIPNLPTGSVWSSARNTVLLSGLNSSVQQIWPIDLATGAAGTGFGTSGPGMLTSPGALAEGPDDRIYVIDATMSGKRIVGFDPDGTYHHEFPLVGTAAASALAISPDGRLYTADGNGGGDVYDLMAGTHLGTYAGSAAGTLDGKPLLRFDDAGYLYLIDPATGLHVFNPPMDTDGDDVDDDVDNCPLDANADQLNSDELLAGGDLLGDACDGDDDADTVLDDDDACAGFDDLEDSDADLLPDGCDPCSNAGAQDLNVKPSLGIRNIGTDATPGNEGLSLKGSFILPSTFASLDPAATGIRVVITAQDGSVVADVTVPGGTGWSAPNAKKHQFSDKTGANNGITGFQLSDQNSKEPNLVAIKLTAKNGTYPMDAGDEPLTATVVVGDASLGECTETAFASGACEFNGAGSSIKCR